MYPKGSLTGPDISSSPSSGPHKSFKIFRNSNSSILPREHFFLKKKHLKASIYSLESQPAVPRRLLPGIFQTPARPAISNACPRLQFPLASKTSGRQAFPTATKPLTSKEQLCLTTHTTYVNPPPTHATLQPIPPT